MLDIQKLERKKKDKTYTSFMHHYKTTFPSMQCYTNTVLLHRSTTKIYSTTITIKFTKKKTNLIHSYTYTCDLKHPCQYTRPWLLMEQVSQKTPQAHQSKNKEQLKTSRNNHHNTTPIVG